MHRILVDPQQKKPVSEGMFGLFFEDINYNLDGGLYAELIENRNFESHRCYGIWDDYKDVHDGLYAWRPLSKAELLIETEDPVAEENPHYLHVISTGEGDGFANKAYDGVCLKKDTSYTVSFYARVKEQVKVHVGVLEGGFPFGIVETLIELSGKGWQRYTAQITAADDVTNGLFTVCFESAGEADFDWMSLMPDDAALGIFRKDLFEMLKAMEPGFMRFPGGCIVEGNNLSNRYQWKKTVGPKEHRVYNWNRWAVHGVRPKVFPGWERCFEGPDSHYGQTYGVGFYEYFLLCEAIGAKPLPVLSVGLACEYQSTELVPIDDPEFETYIQDALDLIEFANGPVSSKWGGLRAQMGHAEPFGLTLLGIGNEQWQTEFQDFYERYEIFEKRIHAVYPEMKLIGTAGPDMLTPRYEDAWKWIRGHMEENPDFAYAVDEHYYVKPEWLYEHADVYDSYPRNAKVFAGEYAAHIPGQAGRYNAEKANTFEAALAEAAFMTGFERNSDVVVMASYAPLLARAGHAQWSPDLIWFDGNRVYGTPSYYVQKLYSLYHGSESYQTVAEGDGLYASVTADQEHTYIKLVNAKDEPVKVQVEGLEVSGMATRVELSAGLKDRNSLEKPDQVVPAEREIDILANEIEVNAQSFIVIVR